MNEDDRPLEEQTAAETLAEGSPPSMSLDGDEWSVRPRDLIRATTARSVKAHCLGCRRTFRSGGAAASHAGSARHVVAVDFRSEYVYIPREHDAEEPS